jgi:hypothetical protein
MPLAYQTGPRAAAPVSQKMLEGKAQPFGNADIRK